MNNKNLTCSKCKKSVFEYTCVMFKRLFLKILFTLLIFSTVSCSHNLVKYKYRNEKEGYIQNKKDGIRIETKVDCDTLYKFIYRLNGVSKVEKVDKYTMNIKIGKLFNKTEIVKNIVKEIKEWEKPTFSTFATQN